MKSYKRFLTGFNWAWFSICGLALLLAMPAGVVAEDHGSGGGGGCGKR